MMEYALHIYIIKMTKLIEKQGEREREKKNQSIVIFEIIFSTRKAAARAH